MISSTPPRREAMADPKRVGIDARMVAQTPSGVGNYISSLLLPMCSTHPDTQFFLYSNSSISFPEQPNVSVHEWGHKVGPLWMNTQVPKAVARDRIDVFWGANGIAPVLRFSPPTVVTVHDLVYRFAGETMGRGARWTKLVFQGWSVKRASQVVAVSNATAEDVAAVYGRRADAVIHPPVDRVFRRAGAEVLAAIRLKFELPQRYWLSAGTLEPRKNLVQLLEAYLATLQEGHDLPMLVLAGSAGWGGGRLNALIAAGIEANKIRKLGYVAIDDLAGLYGACELLWMPSIYEGFGMPLLEAQHCGAAVVHGAHASMVEASAALGVATGTDSAALRETLRSLARSEAPLACRLIGHDESGSAEAARRMWGCLCVASRDSPEPGGASAPA